MSAHTKTRMANWDLLRALSMFLVVMCHCAPYIGTYAGYNMGYMVSEGTLICDALFFTLSGFFALRPLKTSLGAYYKNKFITLLLPLFVFAGILYLFYALQPGWEPVGFFDFFNSKLHSGWWFIPALVPSIMVAPFLTRALDGLDKRQLTVLMWIVGALSLWGILGTGLQWIFNATGHYELSQFSYLLYGVIPPAPLMQTPQYFMFFLLGGIFLRLKETISRKTGIALCVAGFALWALDLVYLYIGAERMVLSYFWLWPTLGTFYLIDHLRIKGRAISAIISWCGKRAYSLYLLHLVAVNFVMGELYTNNCFGVIADFSAPARVGVWLCGVLCAWALSLAAASVLDPFVLQPIQKLVRRVIPPHPKTQDLQKGW